MRGTDETLMVETAVCPITLIENRIIFLKSLQEHCLLSLQRYVLPNQFKSWDYLHQQNQHSEVLVLKLQIPKETNSKIKQTSSVPFQCFTIKQKYESKVNVDYFSKKTKHCKEITVIMRRHLKAKSPRKPSNLEDCAFCCLGQKIKKKQ